MGSRIYSGLYWLLRISVRKNASPMTLSDPLPLHLYIGKWRFCGSHCCLLLCFRTDILSSQHRPIYTVLEDQFELLLANAHEIKALPGRKTDVRDCEWIADLLQHGLIHPSFIPAKPVRVLRDLMRYRKSLVYQHSQDINRLHKVLETATIKLTSVVSDVWGKSGQSMRRRDHPG